MDYKLFVIVILSAIILFLVASLSLVFLEYSVPYSFFVLVISLVAWLIVTEYLRNNSKV